MTKKTVPLKAILALVQYLEVDERKHFEMKQDAGEDTSKHVFNDVRIVSDWLDQQPGFPVLKNESGDDYRQLKRRLPRQAWR